MARFNATTYKPKDDSSPAVLPKGTDPAKTLILAKTDEDRCPCGCDQSTAKNSTFRMGHDARLKGKLIRAHLTGTLVCFAEPKGKDYIAKTTEPAAKVMERFGWTKQLRAAEKINKARREAKPVKKAAKAPAPAAPKALTRGQKAAATRKANAAKKAELAKASA